MTTLDAESMKMLEFLASKVKNAEFEYDARRVWQEFKETTGSIEDVDELERRFRDELVTEMYTMKEFSIKTKAQILFATKTIVDPMFLHRLKKDGKTVIDENGRIISFTARQNSANFLSPVVTKRGKKRATLSSKSQNDNPFQKRNCQAKKRHGLEEIQLDSEGDEHEEEAVEEPIDSYVDYQERIPEQIEKRVRTESENEVVIYDDAGETHHLIQCHQVKTEPQEAEINYNTGNSSSSLEEVKNNDLRKENASAKELLKNIKVVLIALEHSELDGLMEQVKSLIKKFEAMDKMVPLNDIKIALDMILLMVLKSSNDHLDIKPSGSSLSRPGTSSEAVTSEASVNRFLELLRFVVMMIHSTALDGITVKIIEKLGELSYVEETIAVNTIRVGLESLIIIINR